MREVNGVYTVKFVNMIALSAVRVVNSVNPGNSISFLTSITKNQNFIRKMSLDWQASKESFLSMKLEEKRKFYSCKQDYKLISNLPTWDEYYRNKIGNLPAKIEILGGFEIDPSKNEELAKKISIFHGDITKLEIDAIVNAANNSLLGGGGVDGAIHRSAGKELKLECASLKGCQTGEAKITGGYCLPAKYVIHTVGPRREKPDLLTLCYKNSLDIMRTEKLRTIAFPCISTGIYGYPIDKAAHVAIRQVRTFLEKNGDYVDRIIFCLFADDDVETYEGSLQSYFPVSQ